MQILENENPAPGDVRFGASGDDQLGGSINSEHKFKDALRQEKHMLAAEIFEAAEAIIHFADDLARVGEDLQTGNISLTEAAARCADLGLTGVIAKWGQ